MSEQPIRREIAESAAGLMARYVAIIFVTQTIPGIVWLVLAVLQSINNNFIMTVIDVTAAVLCFWATAKSLRNAFMKVARIAGYY